MRQTLTISSAAVPVCLGSPALEPVRQSGREGLNHFFEHSEGRRCLLRKSRGKTQWPLRHARHQRTASHHRCSIRRGPDSVALELLGIQS